MAAPAAPLEPPARGELPFPTGVFQVAEKMEKRTCALCPKDLEYSVLYFARSENIAAHENCLLYSSALVECEDHDPQNSDRNFDVESVKKEIQRGRKLKCTFCGTRGATVGCDLKSCTKNYHFFCAKEDHAFPQADGNQGTYRLLCQQHAPEPPIIHPNPDCSHMKKRKRRGRRKHLSTDASAQSAETKFSRFVEHMEEESVSHTDVMVKVPFLKKCKEAGLLSDLFEVILDKLHLLQARLMDETASESDYEEIGNSLFECRLFEEIFIEFQEAIKGRIHESEERQKQLKEEFQKLQDLKQILCSYQESRDLNHSSSTSVSSLSP